MEHFKNLPIMDVNWHSPTDIPVNTGFTALTAGLLFNSIKGLQESNPEKALLTAGAGLGFFAWRYIINPATYNFFLRNTEADLKKFQERKNG